ncbi:hypothetical protein A1O3_03447 [Capronia epimyces CBS 606.96]|uniref:Mei2-like C-terminal RNA recognition motif domain-containing protein n=1 Tax=Capronia epimyces CBS 606.96 TaxID=1182542 RepID=W9YB70_9EURO|nr:uncharacterized protein A1O3_03447 [Capronia epimyces CBS 606.96]EXJ86496.1 hypothetical protein A1O3_03447 [Capronia epimyces CBS 606.96]
MSSIRCTGMASSPHSENETSSHGTPSTNPTTFSPEAASGTKGKSRVIAIMPCMPARQPLKVGVAKANNAGDDVFLNAPASTNIRQLSPTAEVFTPGAQTPFKKAFHVGTRGNVTALPMPAYPYFPSRVPSRGKQVNSAEDVQAGGVSSLLKGSTPERKAKALTPEQAQPIVPGVIGGPRIASDDKDLAKAFAKLNAGRALTGTSMYHINYSQGIFSTDENVTRAFVVTGIPESFRSTDIAAIFKTSSFSSLRSINASQLVTHGLVTLSFADVREAKLAFEVASTRLPLARVFPLPPKGLASDEGKDPHQVTDFEGQVIVTVYYNGHPAVQQKDAYAVVAEIKRLLAQCGPVKAFHTLAPTQIHVREFRVEFFNADVVEAAKDVISGTMTFGMVLDVEPYKPDVRDVATTIGEAPSPREQLSITGRSTVPVDPDYDRLAVVIQRDALRTGRRLNQNANHNAVDIARIQAGIDVRTTIMLRNIPNRVDQLMLKKLIDVTSHGRYDFMYLRIDFANNCNVGYAFINFVDFVLARAGKRWNCFASDKVAEVSYATIQGKDCLVQKFRNSSVMLEHPSFRPKLFITGNVPTAGNEERFPGPDNASKMRRSVENAEHVGLFVLPSPTRRPFPMEHRLRRVGQTNVGNGRRSGRYLPPARATTASPQVKETAGKADTPSHGSVFFVNVNSPYDPFAGSPAQFS